MRDIIKPAIVLLIIAGITAGLLGYVNSITLGPIADAEAKTKQEKMSEVLSCDSWDEPKKLSDSGIIKEYSRGLDSTGNTTGYAFAVETKGFSAGLNLMIGINKDGVIQGIAVVSHQETAGLGANAGDPKWAGQFKDKEGHLTVGTDIDAITGATITSKAVTDAVNTVTDYYNSNLKGGSN